jgi:hypothetical protein
VHGEEGRSWSDVIVLSNKQIKEDLLLVDSNISGLRREDGVKFLELRENFLTKATSISQT